MNTRSIAAMVSLLVAAAAAAQAAEPRQGTSGGIGVLIEKKDNVWLRVAKALPDGPAARAGIRSGEIIQGINGTPTATLSPEEAADLIHGPVGTAVELDVSGEGGAHWRKVRLVRESLDPAAALQGAPGGDLTSDQWQNLKQFQRGTFGGVGALMKKEGGVLRIVETVANSPAARAGIRPGAIIQAINGAPGAMLTDTDAAKLIRGPAGTAVELDISDEGAPNWHKVRLVREAIVVGVYYRMLDRGIGVLSITDFNKQTPASVKQALGALGAAGARGVVIDLRDSSPGLSAITDADVAGFFVGNAAPLWLERDYGQAQATPIQSSQRRIWNKPVVVLVNERTSRNSVRLAAALRSAGRATLVGRKTAGASAIEWFEKQADGSARRTAMKLIFTLRDEPISSQGLTPDVPLDAGLSDQQQLARAAAVLSPPPPISRTDDVGAR